MSELRVVYLLRWFDPSSEWLVGEELLETTSAGELRALFDLPADDPVFNVYPVGDREAAALQPRLAHGINRDSYVYFVEAQQLIG